MQRCYNATQKMLLISFAFPVTVNSSDLGAVSGRPGDEIFAFMHFKSIQLKVFFSLLLLVLFFCMCYSQHKKACTSSYSYSSHWRKKWGKEKISEEALKNGKNLNGKSINQQLMLFIFIMYSMNVWCTESQKNHSSHSLWDAVN